VKFLLDTHTLLWHSDASPQMSTTAAALLSNPSNDLYLSMASAWEIAIKSGIKKLVLSAPFTTFIGKAIVSYKISLLPITIDDCL